MTARAKILVQFQKSHSLRKTHTVTVGEQQVASRHQKCIFD